MMSTFDIQIHGKTPRVRGSTWTDEEVHKLFHVWSQPSIFNGFLNEKRKREIFVQLSTELTKLGVNRSWEECRAKIKNLKGDYKKAREHVNPQSFKYYTLMEKILSTTPAGQVEKTISVSTSSRSQCQQSQAMQIEFEIMPANEIDFQSIKGELPIQISQSGSIIIPDYSSDVEDVEVEETEVLTHEVTVNEPIEVEAETQRQENTEDITPQETDNPLEGPDGTPLIVITSTETTHAHGAEVIVENPCESTSKRFPYRESYTNAGKKNRKSSSNEICHKRRKLHSISEKMAETVDRILTQTTNSLIEEIKASEERYMQWEEKKRLEDQKREEKLLQTLVDAIRKKPTGEKNESKMHAGEEGDRENRERQRILEMINSADDPCAMTFDLMATRLTNMLNDQQKDTEQVLLQWETKMQRQEMKHTENLFNMIINSVRSHDTEEYS